MSKTGDLSNLRKEYLQSGIIRENLNDSPIEQFSLWFSQAMEANIIEPSAMSLATSDDSIGIRTVLLKYFDEKGFVFFTNYESKKSKQIQQKSNNQRTSYDYPNQNERFNEHPISIQRKSTKVQHPTNLQRQSKENKPFKK